jgi:hypothetical protein
MNIIILSLYRGGLLRKNIFSDLRINKYVKKTEFMARDGNSEEVYSLFYLFYTVPLLFNMSNLIPEECVYDVDCKLRAETVSKSQFSTVKQYKLRRTQRQYRKKREQLYQLLYVY